MAKKSTTVRSAPKTPQFSHWGPEPEWDSVVVPENDPLAIAVRFSHAYSWYNALASDSDTKQWTLEWAKANLDKETYALLKNGDVMSGSISYGVMGPKHYGCKIGVLCRMDTLKAPLLEADRGRLKAGIEFLIQYNTKAAPVEVGEDSSEIAENSETVTTKIGIKDRVDEQVADLCSELNTQIDLWLTHNCKPLALYKSSEKEYVDFDVSRWVTQNNIKSIQCNRLSKFLTTIRDEVEGSSKVKFEGWDYLTKKTAKDFIAWIDSIVSVLDSRSLAAKASRKPRKRKTKSPVDIVKKLKFLKEDTGTGVKSIPASRIVAADKLIVYNTKYKTLTIYEARDRTGLNVKGSTIINWDENKSLSKRVSKNTKDVLKTCSDDGIRSIKAMFGTLKGKSKTPNGRINGHTLLVSVK